MFRSLKESITTAAEDATLNYARGGVDYLGIPSGIRVLDVLTGGFRKKDIYLIGGRTGLGKSSLALTFASHAASFGASVGYVSLEMSAEVLAYRYLAAQTGINSMKIERGRVTAEEITIIQNYAANHPNLGFYVDDTSHTSETLVKALTDRDDKFDIVFVDYLTLLRDTSSENEAERLGHISAALKGAATTLDIPIVVLVQLNRETEKTENKVPALSHIRGSGAPEHDAAGAILIHRPHFYAMMHNQAEELRCETDAQIILAKNRHGPAGVAIPVNFWPQKMLWEGKD